ncbi:primosomal replication protein N [Colwellia sp. 4_MG-2023]|jgi:primosomal replication protein N|uniref:primosomal replication protein N n=1 Tax=unclassified Colwellia TaxID=196834 RepID=UPI001C09B345|nr:MULTISPECIES: primosomal replication protein N [unclassified Colwellia]MBU2924155.1 primosomal replication protein N [Colwellia sp. C2M11]MDO6506188.1 primosomal replication protein N [Colwellia sp. 5_MG-2023]MDO6554752.1 primosomal replication protein N [Colwellia sp. 4_MG-2023]MDO6652045.1 primosomal replication protein N [Colwellia sp. 3_MG-2023]MDO6664821.1 primosomal replication protein N [Colwellia sp. 2_MG-2023]
MLSQENSLVLTGSVVKAPKQSTSPAGITHSQFSMDHKSIQNEAGMNRQAFVRIQVVATGELSHLTRELVAGDNVRVTGFINRHESRNGNPLLVLHSQHIEMIN